MTDEKTNGQTGTGGRLPLIPILLILIILGFALFGQKGILRSLQASRHHAALEAEVQQQEAVIQQLKKEIKSLRFDRKYIEGIARRELGMVKEDELVYQFAQGSDKSVAETEPPASQ
jgi:cell division protein FtsB/cell division protein DivIC